MSKGIFVLLIIFFCGVQHCEAGSVDRFAAQTIVRGGIQIIKKYPLMTAIALAVVFRKELFSFIVDRDQKRLVLLVGEHPFISFALGIGILSVLLGDDAQVPVQNPS